MKKKITTVIALFSTVLFAFAQDDQYLIGKNAPSFILNAIDGKAYSLEQLRGKYVVIHFSATWCPFCNAEAPHLEELYMSYRNQNVQVLIIDVKEDKGLVEKSVSRFGFSFPVLLDLDGAVSAKYAPEGVQPDLARDEVPLASNLIIDKDGNIRFYSLLNSANFDAKLTKLKQKLDGLLSTK